MFWVLSRLYGLLQIKKNGFCFSEKKFLSGNDCDVVNVHSQEMLLEGVFDLQIILIGGSNSLLNGHFEETNNNKEFLWLFSHW